MGKRHNHWPRKAAALVCLFAVGLLQAPFARAAWLAATSNCCMSDHCSVPGHHHQNVPAKDDMPMDCGHGMKYQADCKISCCKTTDETVINVAQFVMPDLQIALSLERAFPFAPPSAPQMISRAEKPQSPPPRIALS
ncbi:MAG TPA: hypothetical protein VN025_02120 [Candidatus Dormibacteraeota bacterium]|jgi:hypothetical protein|nr:hypothetical protein [Candidatus Dormibacteraeota bacterium]